MPESFDCKCDQCTNARGTSELCLTARKQLWREMERGAYKSQADKKWSDRPEHRHWHLGAHDCQEEKCVSTPPSDPTCRDCNDKGIRWEGSTDAYAPPYSYPCACGQSEAVDPVEEYSATARSKSCRSRSHGECDDCGCWCHSDPGDDPLAVPDPKEHIRADGDYPNPSAGAGDPIIKAEVFTDSLAIEPHVNILIDHQLDGSVVGGRKLGISMSPERAMRFGAEVVCAALKAMEQRDASS